MIPVIKRRRGVALPAGAVYVGRPTLWGNPFRFGEDAVKHGQPERTRDEAIALYREVLDRNQIESWRRLRALAALKPTALACWCAPEACHGDVLAELLVEAQTGSGGPVRATLDGGDPTASLFYPSDVTEASREGAQQSQEH